MKFRDATTGDEELLLWWRNDEQSRKNSIKTDIIEVREHNQWFQSVINNPEHKLLIACNEDGIDVGTVRFDLISGTEDSYEISWTVAPEWRGKGVGKEMVIAAIEQPFLKGKHIKAQIKSANEASIKIAQASAFTLHEQKNGFTHWWKD